jgi:hypothetical protein
LFHGDQRNKQNQLCIQIRHVKNRSYLHVVAGRNSERSSLTFFVFSKMSEPGPGPPGRFHSLAMMLPIGFLPYHVKLTNDRDWQQAGSRCPATRISESRDLPQHHLIIMMMSHSAVDSEGKSLLVTTALTIIKAESEGSACGPAAKPRRAGEMLNLKLPV